MHFYQYKMHLLWLKYSDVSQIQYNIYRTKLQEKLKYCLFYHSDSNQRPFVVPDICFRGINPLDICRPLPSHCSSVTPRLWQSTGLSFTTSPPLRYPTPSLYPPPAAVRLGSVNAATRLLIRVSFARIQIEKQKENRVPFGTLSCLWKNRMV